MSVPTPSPAKRSIRLETEIKAPAEQVWKALTDAEELVKWFAPEAKVTPGEGGEVYLSWGEGMGGSAKITIWDPPHHLQLVDVWQADASENPRVQDWHIEPAEGGVRLRLVHSGFGPEAKFDAEYDSMTGGWKTYFIVLKFQLEQHSGEPCVNVTEFSSSDLPYQEGWTRLTGPQGLNLPQLAMGARYGFTTPEGDVLAGEVRRYDPLNGYLGLTVEGWNNALFGLFCEQSSRRIMVTIQLYLYAEATKMADAQRAKWRAFIDRLIPKSAG